MSVQVTVTAEDIQSGQKISSASCPIALAIRREFPDAPQVLVGSHVAQITQPSGASLQVPLPPQAQQFVRSFDHGEAGEPFAFALDLASAVTVFPS